MKEAYMRMNGHDGREAEEDEVPEFKVTGEYEFTVMQRTGKRSGRTIRRKADGDAMINDSTERPQQQKRGAAEEAAYEDAQAKKQQAIEVPQAEAAGTAGGAQRQQQKEDEKAPEEANRLAAEMEEDLMTDDTGDEAETARANAKPGEVLQLKKIKKSQKQAKLDKRGQTGGSGSRK